jgi:hypothetical protein
MKQINSLGREGGSDIFQRQKYEDDKKYYFCLLFPYLLPAYGGVFWQKLIFNIAQVSMSFNMQVE